MSEGLWYGYNAVWYSEEKWLNGLDFVVWTQENFLQGTSRVYIPMLKLIKLADGTYYPLPTGCTPEQMFTYAFASTLLGISTNQNYFGTTFKLPESADFIEKVYNKLFSIDVGAPVNDYYVIEGTHVYARDFTNVKVMVNPTGNPYVANGETIDPHTGVIIQK